MENSKLGSAEQSVQSYYTVDDLDRLIRDGLAVSVADRQFGIDDLAPVDEFHIRGRQSTSELADLVEITPDAEVLDVGSGIGGTARYLANRFGCSVTGIDLSTQYCRVATGLSESVGMGERTRFVQGSALDLPFHDETFDVVWTEHVQMNIADKLRFYSEIYRVLSPGGQLIFHDVFRNGDSEILLPVPWAERQDLNHLVPQPEIRALLESLGFEVMHCIDSTEEAIVWINAVKARAAEHGPPPLGVHLHMGSSAPAKIANLWRNLNESRVRTFQAVFVKS